MLKRVSRSGWSVLGIKNPESVAEHSFRCSVIGYILAKMEGADPYQVLIMSIFGDLAEARITDLHKMAQRYVDARRAEDQAFKEQIKDLPKPIRDDLSKAAKSYRGQKSPESIIARDADILECLIQAKEYDEIGYKEAIKFTKKAPKFLKTKSAQKIWELARKNKLNDWWVKLSEFKR